MTDLRSEIEVVAQQLAGQFADAVLAILRKQLDVSLAPGAPAPSRPKNGASAPPARRVRRGPEDVAKVIEAIVGALAEAPKGLRSEQLQKALGYDRKTLDKPLMLAVADGMIRKIGERRSTTYLLPKGKDPVMPPPPKGEAPLPKGVIRRKKKTA